MTRGDGFGFAVLLGAEFLGLGFVVFVVVGVVFVGVGLEAGELLFLTDGEARALLVLPVVQEMLGLDFVVVGVPAATEQFLRGGHTMARGVFFVRDFVFHYVEQEEDYLAAFFAVLAQSLGEVRVQGVVVVGFLGVVD